MLLRPAALPDLPALLDVQQAGAVGALAHIFPQDDYPFPRADLERRWAAEIADPAVDVYVVQREAGRIEGFAAVRGDELLHLGTAVETWGSGLAAAVHDELRPMLGPRGRLWVFEANRRARRFYEKLGWRRTGRRRRSAFAPYPALLEYETTASTT
jgi:RimJ/RimL family protein N-acetyltransferase